MPPNLARKAPNSFTPEAVRDELTAKVTELIRAQNGGLLKERIHATARYLGLSFARTQDFWHRHVRRIEAHEADQIRAYYKAAQELVEARKDYEKIRQRVLSASILARLAPGPLEDDAISAEAEAAAKSELAGKLG